MEHYIWTSKNNQGRNLYGLFRRVFYLKEEATDAEINIFADNSYELFVNGQFIQLGPVRFDPKYPLYDTHYIKKHLKQGKNVISIKANYFGGKTYKSMESMAGLITWGFIKANSERISLESNKEDWKCIEPFAHRRYAPKISFALNSCELYEYFEKEAQWQSVHFDDSNWCSPVELPKRDVTLKPRSIPHMSIETINTPKIICVLPLDKKEISFSFSVPVPHFYEDSKAEVSNFIAFSTWIHSPCKQELTMGGFWGEYWLNGEDITNGLYQNEKNMRINRTVKLNKGFNYFFGKVLVYNDIFDCYLTFPNKSGVTFSADKTLESQYAFKHSPIISREQYQKHLASKPFPYSEDETLEDIGGYVFVSKEDKAQNPVLENSWEDFGEPFEKPDDINGHTFALERYPDGFTIVYDLGHTHLFLPRIKLCGVKGATVDVISSEYILSNRILREHNYCGGDRILSHCDTIDWLATHPRGGRYVKLTVRNANCGVTIKEATFLSVGYPVKRLGTFKCSDALLNQIWEMGALTQEINMEDAYVDCVARERGMYARDTIIQYFNNLALFGDNALMKRCLTLYGQSCDETGKFRAVYPNTGSYTISDFCLNMPEGYLAYYHNTGDVDFISQSWDAIMGNINWFNNLADKRDDLLLDTQWHINSGTPQTYGGFHGDLSDKNIGNKKGIGCMFSCNYLIALRCVQKLADVIGEADKAQNIKQRADKLEHSIKHSFWDDRLKCFADNLDFESHSVHSNILAVLANAVDDEQREGIKAFLDNNLTNLFKNGHDAKDGAVFSPSYAFYIFDGLYQLGLSHTAENLMRQGWGWMLAQGLKTCPEYFDIGGSQSLCHAWSASPTYYLSRYVLGIHFPEAPNLDVVEIKPMVSSISHACGTFPHPRGIIEIKWHLENGIRIFDYIKLPKDVILIEDEHKIKKTNGEIHQTQH